MRYLVLIICATVSVTFFDVALAATKTLNVGVFFKRGLQITKVKDMNFGTLVALKAANYRIDINGNVTTTGQGMFLDGPTSVGEAIISGSDTQRIDISSQNYIPNNGVGILVLRCKYHTTAERNCESISNLPAPGAGKTLLIAGRISVDGTQTPGTVAAPTFDIVVTYH